MPQKTIFSQEVKITFFNNNLDTYVFIEQLLNKTTQSIKSLDLSRPHEAACYTILRFLKSVIELSEFISDMNMDPTKDPAQTVSATYYKGGPSPATKAHPTMSPLDTLKSTASALLQ